MKQDIIHKCMTEFAAKDSIWGANLFFLDGIECTYTCCGGCQPLNWKGTSVFFWMILDIVRLVSIRCSSCKWCLHKSIVIVFAFNYKPFLRWNYCLTTAITHDYTWVSTEEYIYWKMLQLSQRFHWVDSYLYLLQ